MEYLSDKSGGEAWNERRQHLASRALDHDVALEPLGVDDVEVFDADGGAVIVTIVQPQVEHEQGPEQDDAA